ncbi:hypothetical protein Cgig2_030041 [Carnegiea gigantea]|uniref:Uncharacterized protein n=1 Tax=Carnegiea gigantea TaxID=171969 RepID=A0A9Q1QBE9_9CARY|nr:hypothetical protein Cgig2_030041 [Carnegiea gigantea]
MGKKLLTQPKRLCFQGNSNRPTSVCIATTTGESSEASSDAHTEEYIPLEKATPTPTPTSTFPGQCSQPGLQPLNLCYLDRVVFKVRAFKRQFPTLRGWTNDKMKSREEQEFEVGFGKSALEDRLEETEIPDEAQAVYEEEPSNATPEPAAEVEHDTVRSKIKALLEDAKKVSNEIITNTRVLARMIMELEKLVPEAHASLKRVRTIAVQTTTDPLFAETTLPGKSKSTKPVLSPDPYESEDFLLAVEAIEKQFLIAQKSEHHFPQFTLPSFSLSLSQEENEPTATQLFIREVEHQEESVVPATGVVIRELDVDVPLRDVQEASYVGKGKAIMEEVSRRPRTRSIELDANVPMRDILEASYVGKGKGIMEEVSMRPTMRSMRSNSMQVPTVESNHAMKPEYGEQRTPCTFLICYSGAWIFVARVIVVDHYSSFSSKKYLRDRQVLALR